MFDDLVRCREWWRGSAIADHCEEDLFDSSSSFDIRSRHGTGHRGGEAMMPVVLSGLVLVLLTVLCVAGEFLMELPQLDLKLFE